ncbi:MAG: hypothetical protein RH947_06255 [Alcanivorax sp.]
MIRIILYSVFCLASIEALASESVKLSITDIYEKSSGFFVAGQSLSAPCVGERLEFEYGLDAVSSESVYLLTKAYVNQKPVYIVYDGLKGLCDDGELLNMEVLSDG